MGDTDYSGNGFNQGGDGAIFGDPGSDPGSVSDYDTWDWKQIEAAINGMSAGVDDSDNQSHALAVSDPNSLNKAANAFYAVQVTLSEIADSLDAQAKALAGPDGPWKGDAADSFITMMTTFSRQVKATADVLSGGATGTHSIPQQLADNAVNLLNAKNKIVEIDNWYANQAIQMGVHPMSNGLIPISQKPQLVQMMTSDMRAVLKSLAGEYQVTIDSVRSPQPITSPGDNNPDTIPQPNPDDLTNTDGLTDPGLQPANLSDLQAGQDSPLAPFPGDLSTGDGSGLPFGGSDPALMDAALNPAGGIGDPSPFPGGTDTGGLNGLADPAAFPGGTDTGGPGGLGDPSAFPGGTDVGTGPNGLPLNSFTPTPFPLSTSTKAASQAGTGEDGLTDPLTDGAGDSFPGELGTGGTGGLGDPASFPGSLSTESGLPDGTGLDSGLGDGAGDGLGDGVGGLGAPGSGEGLGDGLGAGGMPYMPGMGGGAGQGQGQNLERSDASGLLSGDAEPWAGSTDVGGGEAGSPLGALAGGPGLDGLGGDSLGDGIGGLGAGEGLGEGGMPYLPGMGGGAGQGQGQNNERSDASGLLSGDAEPWSGLPEAAEEAGTLLGAAAGGPGLHGLGADLFAASPVGEPLAEEPVTATALPDGEWSAAGADEAAAAEAEQAAGAGEGMPYMPGMGGGAGPGQGQANERSDASGLLEGDGEPWEGAPAATGEAGSPQGAAAGAAGLELGAEAAAVEVALSAAAVAATATVAGAQTAQQHQHQRRHEDPVAVVPLVLAGEAVAWSEEPAAAEPPAGEAVLTQEAVEAAATAEAEALEQATAGAVAEPEPPLALVGGADAGSGEESAAWDVGGDTLVPLLWGLVGPEEERDVLSSGYATAEDGTWGAHPVVAPAGDAEEEEGPTWTTWRPDQTPAPGGLTAAAIAATGALTARSTDEVPEEEPEEQTEEEPAEEPQRRSIADLLVQDGDIWGGPA
ncbi:WXG100 family type VII secretion target [Streptacidiphilus sp. N1-12]|uniref:WXG100 family type VII secretion target n=2 Tax=Streptacidiphilus alkalitolerans TaxID=3342712 RepID=A0ABV6WAH9_9ACTN